jgi:hypothetical protein
VILALIDSSFGAPPYEMTTGERAFGRRTAAETLAPLLTEEPRVEGPTGATVGRCVKKSGAERWPDTEALLV